MIQVCVRPEDVKKVRGLILSLAISGKLTSKEVSSGDISGTFLIPLDWKWCTLSEIAACRGSAKAGSDGIKPSDWILDMEDIDGATGTVHTRATFKERSSLSTKSAFKPGDVLYGKLRPYLNKVVLADSPGFCTTEIIPITPGATIEARYLQIVLRSPYFLEYVTKRSYGMKMPRLGTKDLESARIPLPPLAEQKRIIAKVDELMALCDRLEAQLKERDIKQAALAKAALAKFTEDPTPENLQLLFHPSFLIEPEDLKKIVLHLAIKGKLSTGSAKDSPASQAFQQLQKFSSTSSKERSPDRWIVVRLGHLGEWRGGGTPSKSRPDYWAGTLPWVSPKDMKVLKIADAQDHISPAAVEGSSVRLIPSGSLLMVVRGMILARCFPVAVTTREVTINQDMKALTPHYPEMKDYILIALRSLEKTVLDCIEHSTHGTCKLQTEPLQNTLIPIPPPEEQKRIVEKTEQLLSLIDQLEAKIEASRTTGEKLLEAMVAELTSA